MRESSSMNIEEELPLHEYQVVFSNLDQAIIKGTSSNIRDGELLIWKDDPKNIIFASKEWRRVELIK